MVTVYQAAVLSGRRQAPLDAVTADWLARVAAIGGSVSPTTRTLVDERAKRARANGYLSALLRYNPCVGDTLASSLVPLIAQVGPSVDTSVGLSEANYSESLGWQQPGGAHINIGYAPGATANGGLGGYLRTSQPSGTSGFTLIGGQDFANSFRLTANRGVSFTSDAGKFAGGYGANLTITSPNGPGVGAWHVSRLSSSYMALYFNGVMQGESTSAVSPAAATVAYVLALNNNNAAALHLSSGSRVSAYWCDSGMTPAQAAAFYADEQWFQGQLGRAV